MMPDEGDNQATKLVKLAGDAQLFHDADGNTFVTLAINGHWEVWPLQSKRFKQWVAHRYFEQFNSTPNSQAVSDAANVLHGVALFKGEQRDTAVRVAEHDGDIFLDLGDPDWRAVQIGPAGWMIPPAHEMRVYFRRPRAMLSLPTPKRGGDLNLLRRFINVRDEDWPLILGWAIAALRNVGPYPVLELDGEQGSAKSTTARLLRLLIDPNSAPLRVEPRDPRDLAIAANNGWVIALDNLSRISGWLSDALCRLSTGGGFATRELYSDDDEKIFDAQRPVIITGINELADRGDLLDRSLMVSLPRIPDHQRRPEKRMMADFEQARPLILGALLDVVSAAIEQLPNTELADPPRMADFAEWMTAAETSIGWPAGHFMATYNANRDDANKHALEVSPVATVLGDWLSDTWEGTATELLQELDQAAGEKIPRLKAWPKSAPALSGLLRRLAPNLRQEGVGVEWDRTGRRRLIRLNRESIVTSVIGVIDPAKQDFSGDGDDDGVTIDDAQDMAKTPIRDANDDDDGVLRTQSEKGDQTWIAD